LGFFRPPNGALWFDVRRTLTHCCNRLQSGDAANYLNAVSQHSGAAPRDIHIHVKGARPSACRTMENGNEDKAGERTQAISEALKQPGKELKMRKCKRLHFPLWSSVTRPIEVRPGHQAGLAERVLPR
jgi:hypothetical protein